MNVLWGGRRRTVYFFPDAVPHFWPNRPAVGQPKDTLGRLGPVDTLGLIPRRARTMTWIRTISFDEADEKLRKAIEGEKGLYPKEYATPVHPDASGASSIVGSHTLLPEALYHAFATFGSLMSPDLPLNRRQHEMIATMVSVTNRCKY